MATLTLKNVPDRLYSKLKKSAVAHRRSLNREAIVYLEQALAAPRVDPQVLLTDLERFHRSLGKARLTDEILDEAKRWGRP